MSDDGADTRVARFVADLRRRGVGVAPQQTLSFIEGLAATGGTRVRDVAIATLATSRSDARAIESALEAGRDGSAGAADEGASVSASRSVAGRNEPGGERSGRADPEATAAGGFSAIERLRVRDVATCSSEERAEIHRRLERIALGGPRRRSRRWSRTRQRGSIDPRATLRSAARAGGQAARLERRTPRDRPRRVVLLLDVSGSMAPYTRTMLHLAYAGARTTSPVEVFALGTRLTRLTRHLSSRDPDCAFAAAVTAAPDWGGGTRLGPNVRSLLADPTTNGLVRGAVVVVVSDGLDRGDPDELSTQMARLARHAHRLIWVNPLRAGPGYEPVAVGMRAALPYVDAFVDGHSLDALENLAEIVAERAGRSS